eukprot:2686855-Rhodomonas_salina.1
MMFFSLFLLDVKDTILRLVWGYDVYFPPSIGRALALQFCACWLRYVSEGGVIELPQSMVGVAVSWCQAANNLLNNTPEMWNLEPIIVDWSLLVGWPPLLYKSLKWSVKKLALRNIADDCNCYEKEWEVMCRDARQLEGFRRIAATLAKVKTQSQAHVKQLVTYWSCRWRLQMQIHARLEVQRWQACKLQLDRIEPQCAAGGRGRWRAEAAALGV